MKIDEKLSDVFDIEPVEKITGEIIDLEDINKDCSPLNSAEKIEEDYDTTRANLYKLLESGQDALQTALQIAKQSEHPRAFEVVGNLMKQIADINEQLLTLHMKKQKLDNPSTKDGNETTKQVTNNNAIFVGSTSDLSKMIQNMTKGE